jgi:hypothetical protein
MTSYETATDAAWHLIEMESLTTLVENLLLVAGGHGAKDFPHFESCPNIDDDEQIEVDIYTFLYDFLEAIKQLTVAEIDALAKEILFFIGNRFAERHRTAG